MPKVAAVGARPVEALQSVVTTHPERACAGCGQRFQPRRRDARHCRPSCRARALQRRRQAPLPFDDGWEALARVPFE
jgi:hypothetical protein